MGQMGRLTSYSAHGFDYKHAFEQVLCTDMLNFFDIIMVFYFNNQSNCAKCAGNNNWNIAVLQPSMVSECNAAHVLR